MDMWIVYCTFVGQKMLTRSRTVGDLIAKERVRHAEMRVWSLRLKAWQLFNLAVATVLTGLWCDCCAWCSNYGGFILFSTTRSLLGFGLQCTCFMQLHVRWSLDVSPSCFWQAPGTALILINKELVPFDQFPESSDIFNEGDGIWEFLDSEFVVKAGFIATLSGNQALDWSRL